MKKKSGKKVGDSERLNIDKIFCNLKELYTSGTTRSEMINWTPLMLRVKISIWPPTPVKIVKVIAFHLLFRRSRSFFGRCRSLFGRSRPKSERDLPKSERDLPKSKRLIENGLLRTFQKANGTFQKANGTFQKANRTFQKANRTFQKANGKQFLSRFSGGGGQIEFSPSTRY